jgi:Xaa-Pro aminopeptidase
VIRVCTDENGLSVKGAIKGGNKMGAERIAVLQRELGKRDACAILSYSRNILYYTSTAQPAYLLVSPDEFHLFIKSGLEFALGEVSIGREKMSEERQLGKIRKLYPGIEKFKSVGIELDILTAEQYISFKELFPQNDIFNVSPLVLEQRKTKDDTEIEKLRKACRAIHNGHEAVLAGLKEGMTELDLAALVENAHRQAGHEGIFFIRQPDFFMSRGPISSGANLFRNSGVVYTITGIGLSPAVPAGPSRKKIMRGEPVMIDIPVLVDGYHADQTRTYFIGEAGGKFESMYRDLKDIADHIIENMRQGIKGREIYRMALDRAKELGRENHFQSFGDKRSRLVGHGIGLELNEPPVPSEYDDSPVNENYVICLDLHMMDRDTGVVKLEDMIWVKQDRNEILTISPREIALV